ncbi:MAG: ABC transporter permease [Anaerolineae bacterium]|nr:ABC transporter permease [Anaerolineae bacterium]
MLAYLLRRAELGLLSVLIAVTLTFLLLRIIPGDAVSDTLRRSGASPSMIQQRRASMGLDDPLPVQYAHMLGGLLRGDLGTSLVSGRPVAEVLREQFIATLILASGSLVVAIVIGLTLGALTVLSESVWLRRFASFLATISLASPVYWTGTLAIYLFSVQFRWFPSTGSGTNLRNLLLPWLVLGFSIAGSLARVTAASLANVRTADFIRTARSKGLRERVVLLRHLFRPALTPILAIIALQIGFLLGGTVITEMLFVRQGLGRVMLQAVNERDFTVVQGAVILSAVFYSTVSLIADLIAVLFDPRVRFSLMPEQG